jgi:putative sugar O-methyltransferase
MVNDVTYLSQLYNEITKYISQDIRNSSDSKVNTSKFWRSIFNRRKNFPEFNDLIVFRREDFTFGIGKGASGDISEQKDFTKNIQLAESLVDSAEIEKFSEPLFGAPRFYPYRNSFFSGVFVLNIPTYDFVRSTIRQHKVNSKELIVMEIGPGLGIVSYQLQSTLPQISSYIICDLPENLILSFTYTSFTLRKKYKLVEQTPITKLEPDTNYYSTPNNVNNLTSKIDLFINSFSLQEMDLETVKSYVAFIESRMREDSLFISINSHGKAGVKEAEDYGYQRFKILNFSVFRKAPATLFSTIPYAVTVGHTSRKDVIYDCKHLNVIADLMQLGLDQELRDIIYAFLNGELSATDENFLTKCSDFFAGNDASKVKCLSELKSIGKYSEITFYLAGIYYFCSNKKTYTRESCEIYLAKNCSSFSSQLALLINYYSSNDTKHFGSVLERIKEFCPYLSPEILHFHQKGHLEKMLRTHFCNLINFPESKLKKEVKRAVGLLRKLNG